MKTTKIDWCDCTINPVVGCPRGCKYCYAEKKFCRFNPGKSFKQQHWHPERLPQLYSKAPKSIFLNSMSDICFWQIEWISAVYKAMQDNPQHRYIFLTKDLQTTGLKMHKALNTPDGTLYPQSYLGLTHTEGEIEFDGEAPAFLSVEPIQGEVTLKPVDGMKPDLVIIGAETGNQKSKIVPPKQWIDNLVEQCDKLRIRVFMKSSLQNIMGHDFRQDELPWVNKMEVCK